MAALLIFQELVLCALLFALGRQIVGVSGFFLLPTTTTTTTRAKQTRSSGKSIILYYQKWDDRYEELKEFYEANGHCDVGNSRASLFLKKNNNDTILSTTTITTTENDNNKNSNSSSSSSLKMFVQNQRKEYRKWQRGERSTLNESKIELLEEELQFVWEKATDQLWEVRYLELIDFHAKYGTMNVPMKYKTLGQWVTKHRRAHKLGTLSPEKFRKLERIGFIWNVKEWQFQYQYQKLIQYREQHGHLNVKITDGELGSWFYSRRREYLQYLDGKPTTLSEKHRLALEEVGFGPHLAKRRKRFYYNTTTTTTNDEADVSWETRFEELVQFRSVTNHTRVPKISQYAQLYTWINYQRNLKARGELKRNRYLQLESIDFVWNTNHWLWKIRFNELCEFQSKYGSTNVPRGYGDLGEWVDWQRVQWSNYEKGGKHHTMTAQRVMSLNSIHFDWYRGKTRSIEWDLSWHRHYQELKKWKEVYGDFSHGIRRTHPALGLWAAQQKLQYKRRLIASVNTTATTSSSVVVSPSSTLTEERITQLEEIGFFDD